MKKQDWQKTPRTTIKNLIDIDDTMVVIRGDGSKGVRYIAAEGNLTLGVKHTMQYTDGVL